MFSLKVCLCLCTGHGARGTGHGARGTGHGYNTKCYHTEISPYLAAK